MRNVPNLGCSLFRGNLRFDCWALIYKQFNSNAALNFGLFPAASKSWHGLCFKGRNRRICDADSSPTGVQSCLRNLPTYVAFNASWPERPSWLRWQPRLPLAAGAAATVTSTLLPACPAAAAIRSEEHTSELQPLMPIPSA